MTLDPRYAWGRIAARGRNYDPFARHEPHARPMTPDELHTALTAPPRPAISPWTLRALAGTLPAPTLAPCVNQRADRRT